MVETNASCLIYSYNLTDSNEKSCDTYISDIINNSTDIIQTTCSHEDLVFDQDVVLNSIVTEYGLTCGNKFIKNVIGAVYMVSVNNFEPFNFNFQTYNTLKVSLL